MAKYREDAKGVNTGRGPKGNSYYKDPLGTGRKYQQDSRAKASSKFMRNFNRTKTKAHMTSYDDVHHLLVNKWCLADITAGNPQTAFNLLLDQAWEIAAKTGNIKDLDATQEANYKTWVQEWTVIAWDIAAQMALRPLMPAFTEASGSATSANAIYAFVQSDWDALISSLERLDCPDFIYRFIQPFLFIIQMTNEYERAGLTIPPSYFIPICHTHTLALLQAHREAAKAVMGNAMLHSKKFGIPFSKFSSDKLKMNLVQKASIWDNQDILSYFTNVRFIMYDDGDNAQYIMHPPGGQLGGDKTGEFTNYVYPFIDGKPMPQLHAMAMLCGIYNATNNPFGGIFYAFAADTNELESNIACCKLLATSWVHLTFDVSEATAGQQLLMLFMGLWNGDTEIGLTYMGTAVTGVGEVCDEYDWIWTHVREDLMFGTNLKFEETYDNAMNAMKYCVYGE